MANTLLTNLDEIVDYPEYDFELKLSKLSLLLPLLHFLKLKGSICLQLFLIDQLKHHATEQNLKTKEIFGSVRYMLTGKFHGLGMHDLLNILEWNEIKNRIDAALKILNI